MQHSSLVLFCDECGLANEPAVSHCLSCQHPRAHARNALNASPPVKPITIAPRPILEVRPGLLSTPGKQNTGGDFQPGTILAGRFEIQEEIGRGGFSVVYRAVDLDVNHREVAIKRIQLNSLTPRQTIEATETLNRRITIMKRFRWVARFSY